MQPPVTCAVRGLRSGAGGGRERRAAGGRGRLSARAAPVRVASGSLAGCVEVIIVRGPGGPSPYFVAWSEAAVDGWHSVEDLTRLAFSGAQVVMANEAHSGLARCVRTRKAGMRMIRAAHEAGVRRLAMEALPQPAGGLLAPIRQMPEADAGYLAQPDMCGLIATALELGWALWAYEAAIPADADPAELVSLEFTNRRELEQAHNLCQILAKDPARPLLVWSGNSHAAKQANGEWVPMGHHFAALSGTNAFVIDQTVTVDFTGRGRPWIDELLADLDQMLASFGGTAGVLRDQAPPPLNCWCGVDAVVVSTDNTLI
jgi:hypothetical protein